MRRFFTPEAAVVALSLLLAGVAVGAVARLPPVPIALVSLALVLLLHWPMTVAFQGWTLEAYVARGRTERALRLATLIRDGAPSRKARARANIDLGLVHLARADYEAALQCLGQAGASSPKPGTQAVIEGSVGYALAHLGRDLDDAERHVQAAMRQVPDEPLFVYFLGLVRYRQGRLQEARELINRSLTKEPDPGLPYPGERAYILAKVLEGLGEPAAGRVELERARGAKSRFGELAAAELEGTAARNGRRG